MNLYSIDVRMVATVYVKAENEREARGKARTILGFVELPAGVGEGIEVSEMAFVNPDLPDISLSPAVTVMSLCRGACLAESDIDAPGKEG